MVQYVSKKILGKRDFCYHPVILSFTKIWKVNINMNSLKAVAILVCLEKLDHSKIDSSLIQKLVWRQTKYL